MANDQLRGNPIYFDGEWKYTDDHQPTATTWMNKPCGACKLPNRPDEHDACLGHLPGVINACCGHGQPDQAYVQYEDKSIKRGQDAMNAFKYWQMD